MQIHQFRPVASGAEFQAERLAYKLANIGHQIEILTSRKDTYSPLIEMVNGITIRRVDFSLSYSPFIHISKQLRYLVKYRQHYDIIHSHQCFNHDVIGTVVAKWFRKKSIIKIACAGSGGDLDVFSRFRGFQYALEVLYQADAVIAISSEVEKELLDYGFSRERIYKIPNGVDTEFFKRSKPFPKHPKIIFTLIGRRTPQKGIDIALSALKLLVQKGINKDSIELRLYGWDYQDYNYQKMAEELGVASMVKFFSYTSDVIDIYQNTHCLLLPSRAEGLSNVLLEAMSFEIPVIATKISGTSDVTVDGESGILIPPGNPHSLANAMSIAIENPGWRYRLGKNARQRMIYNFSLDEIAKRYSELYRKVSGKV